MKDKLSKAMADNRVGGQRIYWLDALRGLAIISVVAGHANLGIIQAGLTGESISVFKDMTTVLYLIHMPLFAFLFGVNAPNSIDKNSRIHFVVNRLIGFTYLYILWSFIQGSFEVLGSRFANGNTTWEQVIDLAHPLAHLWYLPWMFLIYLFFAVVRPWRSIQIALLVGGVFGALSWFTWGVSYPVIFGNGLALYFFALLGTLIGINRLGRLASFSFRYLLPLIVVAVCCFIMLFVVQQHITTPTLGDPLRNAPSVLVGMAATCLGVIATVLVVAAVNKLRRFTWLEKIGVHSLQIYLMHLLITPVIRILMVKLGVVNPLIIMFISVIAGVLLPLWVAQISPRVAPWIFSTPRFLTITQKA